MTAETAPHALALDGVPARRAVRLKLRILAGLLCLSALVWLAVAFGLVINARLATEQEVEASFQIAARFIASRIPAIEAADAPGAALAELIEELSEMRHVSATVTEEGGVERSSVPAHEARQAEEDEGVASPSWFTSLIHAEPRVEVFPLRFADDHKGRVLLESDDSDEILEVWMDFRIILPLTMGYGALILVISFVSIDLIFSRLKRVTEALDDLRGGQLETRVPITGYAEFRPLADGVNDLASHLLAKQRENQHLALRLLLAQEDERRRLANDLHDEMGPHLFGIRATAGSLKHLVEAQSTDRDGTLSETVAAIDAQARTIQEIVRRVLSNLRPMSIAKVPLCDSIGELAAEFERISPGTVFDLDCRTEDFSFGDVVDLTVYRFVQESVLNAIRHGRARRVSVALVSGPAAGAVSSLPTVLDVTVVDDGTGPPPKPGTGLGLLGIAERVEALGGSWTAPQRTADETRTSMRVPCALARRIDPDRPTRP
ncbi:histidine kinase [Aureimonas glaciei]|uniref:Sensor histidine kinase n=1 Tax=Aureimonas glaciei TaxID=1776957 RepID=A0A916XTL8_9HYPH|nr:histidine kinase [Aureimonas glaciei]GGD09696.1 sensor histidine kinase [Aureimonas glaciei]